MKISILFAILLTFAQAEARREGPIVVGTGAGDSEYALTLTGQTLPEILSLCDADGCGMDAAALAVLTELKQRALVRPTPMFKSTGSQDGRAFALDRTNRTVFFFQDLLWMDSERTIALDDKAATALWIEILVAMNPNLDEVSVQEVIFTIGARVQAKLVRTKLDINDLNSVTAIVLKNSNGQDRLFIRDTQNKTFDLSSLVSPQCSVVGSFLITATRWEQVRQEGSIPSLQLALNRRYTCDGVSMREAVGVVLPFSKNSDGIIQIDFNRARIFEQGI